MGIISVSYVGVLFVEWEDGSKWEEMGFVEFSDLESAIRAKVDEDMEAAVQRIFVNLLLWNLAFQQLVPLFSSFSEKVWSQTSLETDECQGRVEK